MINDAVTLYPDKVAVVGVDTAYTYQELDIISSQIAQYLLYEMQVTRGSVIGICMDKTPLMVAVMLGIWKSGCAYLPLDPDGPNDRKNYILADSGCRLVCSDSLNIQRLADKCDCFLLDIEQILEFNLDYEQAITGHENGLASMGDLAYILYTSGTTGQPKGCKISHYNIYNLLIGLRTVLRIQPADKWVWGHSPCFDLSVAEIWGALCFGGSVLVPETGLMRDPYRLVKYLRDMKATVLTQTPKAFSALIRAESFLMEHDLHNYLRMVLIAGERLEFRELISFQEQYAPDQIELINLYGITETTVYSTYYRLTGMEKNLSESIIGNPLPGTQIYVLNESFEPVADGEIGELYIGGHGVGQGYINNEQLTQMKFLDCPFRPGSQMYKTGDLVCRSSEGYLIYHGRIDHQIKIRGHRVELGEILSHILQFPEITQAVVIPNELFTNLSVGFIASKKINVQELRQYISRQLPDYMLPTNYVQIDKIPLTMNGKTDMDALRVQISHATEPESDNKTECDETEALLSEIWTEVLCSKKSFDRNSDFFNLGGSSLEAVQVVSLLKEKGFDVDMTTFYANSSIAQLTPFLRKKGDGQVQILVPIERYPLTYYQRKYALQWEKDKSSTGAILVYSYIADQRLDSHRLELAFHKVIECHPILHSVVEKEEDTFYHCVLQDYKTDFLVKMLSPDQTVESSLINSIMEEKQRPFALDKEIPVRVRLLQHQSQSGLIVSFHHLVVDEVSINLFIDQLLYLYENPTENVEGPEYAFAHMAHQEDQLVHEVNSAMLSSWKRRLERIRAFRTHPPSFESGPASELNWSFDKKLTNQIKQFLTKNKVTITSFFTVVILDLLKQIDTFDPIIGITASTRLTGPYHRSIGIYLNQMIIISSEREDFIARCREVQQEILTQLNDLAFPLDYFKYWNTGIEQIEQPFPVLLNFHLNQKQVIQHGKSVLKVLEPKENLSSMIRQLTFNVFEYEDTFRISVRFREKYRNNIQQIQFRDYIELIFSQNYHT